MYGSPFPKPTRQIWKAFLKKAAHHLSNDVRLHWNIPNIEWATTIGSVYLRCSGLLESSLTFSRTS